MADFGKAGKVTIRTEKVAVLVNLTKGEFLSYKLTVAGANGIFTFACQHKPRLSEHQFPGHPKAIYQWDWCRGNPAESDSDDDMYVIAMSFLAATKYTLLVQMCDSAGSVLKTVKDVDYESTSPKDNFTASLHIFTV